MTKKDQELLFEAYKSIHNESFDLQALHDSIKFPPDFKLGMSANKFVLKHMVDSLLHDEDLGLRPADGKEVVNAIVSKYLEQGREIEGSVDSVKSKLLQVWSDASGGGHGAIPNEDLISGDEDIDTMPTPDVPTMPRSGYRTQDEFGRTRGV